jgi:hypothetical protein
MHSPQKTMSSTYADTTPYLTLPSRTSPTRVELSARCHRRHVLSDLLHLGQGSSPAAAFGTIFHKMRHAFWEDQQAGVNRAMALERCLDLLSDLWDLPEDRLHTPELARLLITSYAEQAKLSGNLPGEWHILSLEERREYQLSETWIGYTTDALLENEEGQIAIVDTKTASKLTDLWRRGLMESVQLRAYKALETERLGRRPDYVLIEGVGKRDGFAGLVEYVIADLTWTPEYEMEALQLIEALARKDQGLIRELGAAEPEARWREALTLALTEPELVSFNLMDCESYYFKCPFYEICRACPTERLGLALDTLELEVYDY